VERIGVARSALWVAARDPDGHLKVLHMRPVKMLHLDSYNGLELLRVFSV
jgi:hypothetical protein